MGDTNGLDGSINRVLVIGDNYASSSIIKALIGANIETHVAHSHARSGSYKQITYHKVDTSKDLTSLLSQVKPDLVISTEHGGSYETQKQIIDSVVEADVPRFIPSEFGQDSLNARVQERLPPCRERARTVEYLQERAREGRASFVAIAIGVVLDRGLLRGNLGFDLKWQSATVHGQGHERFAASSASWIGQVILAVVQHWEEAKNQYLYAAGVVVSADEIVRALEQQTGKEFEVGRAYPDECVREAQRRIVRGFPDAGMFLFERSVLYDESLGAVKAFEAYDAKIKLALSGERLEDIIGSVLHEIEHHGGKADCGCD